MLTPAHSAHSRPGKEHGSCSFPRVRAGFLAVLLIACEGRVVGPPSRPQQLPDGPPIGPGTTNGWPTFAPARAFQLRRLTTAQYLTTAKRLLNVSTAQVPPLEPVSA